MLTERQVYEDTRTNNKRQRDRETHRATDTKTQRKIQRFLPSSFFREVAKSARLLVLLLKRHTGAISPRAGKDGYSKNERRERKNSDRQRRQGKRLREREGERTKSLFKLSGEKE